MTKIHPNFPLPKSPPSILLPTSDPPSILTVWQKSLLFNCTGFTVYNEQGNLFFRVDNYSSSRLNQILLMDSIGKPLFTIRRKRFSLREKWNIYKGEAEGTSRPVFAAWKHVFRSKSVAKVVAFDFAKVVYEVEGSFSRRSCVLYDERRKAVAEIQRKEAVGEVGFGGEVFRLVVQPGFDPAFAMAVVIVLERMFKG